MMQLGRLILSGLILVAGCTQAVPPATEAAPSADAALTATTAPVDAWSNTQVLPGQRVGPVTQQTSRQGLVDLFGETRLRDVEVQVGEGFTEPGTRVDLGPDRSFTVVWKDRSGDEPVTARDFGPAWKTPEGIGVGTSFAELQTILGGFQLYGLGWDYGGSLVLADSQLKDYYGQLILRVAPAADAAERAPEALQAVSGDTLFSASDPHFQALDLHVSEMIVYLTPQETAPQTP
jgi:hypothetical protein